MKFINLHTHKNSNNLVNIDIINQYPSEIENSIQYYSTGIHPWKIIENNIDQELAIIESHLKLPNCIALGECGIDKRIETDLNLQIEVFEKQILLAIKYNKPIIIHCVAGFQEVIAIKTKLNVNVPMIIHGFSKNIQTTNQLLKAGLYLSFGKYLMQNLDLQQVFEQIPIDKIFLETDSSDYNIEEVYEKAAKYKNIDILKLKAQIQSNFDKVFVKKVNFAKK